MLSLFKRNSRQNSDGGENDNGSIAGEVRKASSKAVRKVKSLARKGQSAISGRGSGGSKKSGAKKSGVASSRGRGAAKKSGSSGGRRSLAKKVGSRGGRRSSR